MIAHGDEARPVDRARVAVREGGGDATHGGEGGGSGDDGRQTTDDGAVGGRKGMSRVWWPAEGRAVPSTGSGTRRLRETEDRRLSLSKPRGGGSGGSRSLAAGVRGGRRDPFDRLRAGGSEAEPVEASRRWAERRDPRSPFDRLRDRPSMLWQAQRRQAQGLPFRNSTLGAQNTLRQAQGRLRVPRTLNERCWWRGGGGRWGGRG